MLRRFRLELILLGLVGLVALIFLVDLDLLSLGRQAGSQVAAILTPNRILIAGGLLLAGLLLLLRIRWHLSHYNTMYSRTCPHDHADRLMRVHRSRRDKVAGILVNLPLRRYQCKECGWTGLRISRHDGPPLDEFFNPSRDRRK